MAWFRKAVEKMVDITWTPRHAEFERQSMTCPDPHLESYILEVMDFIPEDLHNKVFLAGGFAACFAGITAEFGDIDIFCDSKHTFDKLLALLKSDPENEQVADLIDRPEYGRLWKFKRGMQRFDLVEVTPMAGEGLSLPAILASFDISWCMVGVVLGDEWQVWAHPCAFDRDVKVCSDNIKHVDATQKRVKKYAERIANADMTQAMMTIAAINKIPGPADYHSPTGNPATPPSYWQS